MDSNFFCWYVWKRSVTNPDFRVLQQSDLPNTGFSSVYAIDESSAEALQRTQNYVGFKGVVWSDKLWIDADTEEAAIKIDAGLRESGLGFTRYTTGNRGAHFGINREAAPSQLLPEQDKAWVKARYPEADLKLYGHLHMFRLPGTVHEKTGKPKEIVATVEGTTIIHGRPDKKRAVQSLGSLMNPSTESVFVDNTIMNNSVPCTNGQRHYALLSVATKFSMRKEDPKIALWWLREINKMFTEPKSEEELNKLIHWAYEERDRD